MHLGHHFPPAGIRPVSLSLPQQGELPSPAGVRVCYSTDMLKISTQLAIPDDEIEMHAIRSQGAGGQNVNKLATAIHLRFDINASSLPGEYKERLLVNRDNRISAEGVVIIKAQRFRSQERNRHDALSRLQALIRNAVTVPRRRKPTRPSRAAKQRRLENKAKRSAVKTLRKPVSE